LIRLAAATIASILLGFASFTWWALESSGVAVLETRAEDGSQRSTHVWFTEPGGELWLEAGTPENPWYLDVGREPALSFSSPTRSGEFLARPHPGEAPRQRVRSQLRKKYGLRDWWVGVLFDTSRSVAVELVPSGRAPAAAAAR